MKLLRSASGLTVTRLGTRLQIDVLCSSDAVKVSDEFRHVVIVLLLFFLLATGSRTSEGGLEELVLLGTNLLQNVGQHSLKRLGLRGTADDEQTLSDGELA